MQSCACCRTTHPIPIFWRCAGLSERSLSLGSVFVRGVADLKPVSTWLGTIWQHMPPALGTWCLGHVLENAPNKQGWTRLGQIMLQAAMARSRRNIEVQTLRAASGTPLTQ